MTAQEAASHGLVNAVYETPSRRHRSSRLRARLRPSRPWPSGAADHYARDHSVSDSLQQMGWVQSGIWSNRHVMEAVSAMQAKRAGDFPAGAAAGVCTDTALSGRSLLIE
jgi:enoyl-CoA hydratase